ncbi:MAG: putative DNA binding domain-containing protein [Bacteroidales bacterium]|nr:putative DNA binding domain-containing protein [Bacteroidales bacterium]
MDARQIKKLIHTGENKEIEFKASRFALNKNVYDSICAFLNTKGGHLLLGIEDNSFVSGVNPGVADTIINNLVTNVNNSQVLHPPFYLSPVRLQFENKTIIYVYVPESSQVHNTKGKIFVRNDDGDLNITRNHNLISELYTRKQHTFTENQIYPEVHQNDFKEELFTRTRKLVRNIKSNHPWIEMDNFEIMKSAGLHKRDYLTGKEGYTLAAILLLGHDQVIQSIVPHYKTDALLRIHDKDRYDDRLEVRTNLIESYDLLLDFIKKHLPDKFFLEYSQRKS